MAILAAAPPELYHWPHFRDVASKVGLAHFGFLENWPLMLRFSARYRLVYACYGLKTKGYTGNIEEGYDALTRAFLSWSLYEVYRVVVQMRRAAEGAFFEAYGASALLDSFRTVTGYEKFFGVVLGHADRAPNREAVERFLSGASCDCGKVIATVRHVFAHGYLTPSAGGIEATNAAVICRSLVDFVLRAVETDWRERIDRGLTVLGA